VALTSKVFNMLMTCPQRVVPVDIQTGVGCNESIVAEEALADKRCMRRQLRALSRQLTPVNAHEDFESDARSPADGRNSFDFSQFPPERHPDLSWDYPHPDKHHSSVS